MCCACMNILPCQTDFGEIGKWTCPSVHLCHETFCMSYYTHNHSWVSCFAAASWLHPSCRAFNKISCHHVLGAIYMPLHPPNHTIFLSRVFVSKGVVWRGKTCFWNFCLVFHTAHFSLHVSLVLAWGAWGTFTKFFQILHALTGDVTWCRLGLPVEVYDEAFHLQQRQMDVIAAAYYFLLHLKQFVPCVVTQNVIAKSTSAQFPKTAVFCMIVVAQVNCLVVE